MWRAYIGFRRGGEPHNKGNLTMTDNNTNLEILNGEHAGMLFRSERAAACAMLTDHLSAMGEHGPEYALEIAYTEGQERIMEEIRFCYDYNAEQLKAISDAWDYAIEELTELVGREFDTSFDAADLF